MHESSCIQWRKQVLFNRDFTKENFAGTGIQTRNLPTRVFFIAAVTFLTGFLASSCLPDMVEPLLVASALGDLVAAAIGTVSVTSNQTQSLYIQ